MDTFFEQIVRKKKSGGEIAIILAVLLGGTVLSGFIFFTLQYIGSFLMIGLVYGVWWLITAQNKEYEYCVTNGDIDIDLIIAKRKRVRVVSVGSHKIERLMPYEPTVNAKSFQRVVVAAPSLNEEGLWYFTYHSKKNGHTLVVFQPNERVLRAFYGGLERFVRMDTERAAKEKGITL